MAFGAPVYNQQQRRVIYPQNPPPVDWNYINTLPGGNNYEDPYDQGPDYGIDYSQMAPPAPPPYDPATDPAFQSLLVQLGLKETSARTAAASTIGRLQTEAAVQRPRIAEQGIEQRRNINSSNEAVGTFRSGERLRQLALAQRSQLQRLGDVDRGLAGQIAGVNTTLDQQIRDLAMQRAQYELQARSTAAGQGLYS